MAVQVFLVDMGANDGFIFVTEQTACKFHSRFMRQLWRCFTRHVGVDKMIADNAARFSKPLFRALHIQIAIFYCAVDRALQNHFIIQRSFVEIFNVVQRTGERGFIAVLNIAQTVIQPCTDGNDFVIGHQSVSRILRYACFTRLTASWISACVA